MASLTHRFVRLLGRTSTSSTSTAPTTAPTTTPTTTPVADAYAPEVDGEPDPGEVVWAWVPYEEDPAQGKDRPVLVLRAEGAGWTGLYLSSQDHDRDADDEARHGRYWMDVGSGGWDSQGRQSEVRLDRPIRLERDGVRREGAALDEAVFAQVVDAAARYAGS